MDQQQTIQIQQLAPLVRRRGMLAATIAVVVLLASIVLAAVLPNVYQAYSTILVQPQSISEKLVEPGVKETQLNRRLNLMTAEILSRARLSRIIDELELYQEESKSMTREEVILLMRDRIEVQPILPELTTGSTREEIAIDTFRIFFEDRSPKNAAAVANRLANDFIEEHIRERVRKSGDSSEFIETELQRLEARSREVEAQIAAVAEENAGRLPSDLSTNQRLLERALDMLRIRQIELAQSESDAQFYAGQEALQSLAAGGDDRPDEAPERQIELLEIKLAEQRSRGFTEKHPDVIATLQQIEEHRRTIALREEASEDTGSEDEPSGGGGLATMSAAAEKRRATLRAEAAQRDIDRLLAEIDEIEQRIADTPRVQEQIATLQREYRHLIESTAEFADRRLVASVSADMERRQKGEQFRVLESAFVPPDPLKPNRPLIVVVGALLGLALGAGSGVLREVTDLSFHTARDVQLAFRIPVLAAIPGILLEADRRARRRRRVVLGFFASVVVGIVLTGSAVGYIYVNGAPGFVASLLRGSEAAEPAAAPAAAAGEPQRG